MAKWAKQIDGVIGNGTPSFGANPCDSAAARKMLTDALNEGEGFAGYCDKIKRAYRRKLPNTPEGKRKLDEQMQRVKSIESYFDRD